MADTPDSNIDFQFTAQDLTLTIEEVFRLYLKTVASEQAGVAEQRRDSQDRTLDIDKLCERHNG